MKFRKDHAASYLANHMARLFTRGLLARIKPLGLGVGALPALLELWEKDGLTQKELVLRLDIEQATMANTLGRMERDGLITREQDLDDGRVRRIRLTNRARALRAPALKAVRERNAEALADLTEAEREVFLDLMRRTIETMKRGADG
ncbi:MarR family transcriptional regulator [Pikeienuella sp. HZG-20]|uniref:MarR family winged helix-turn-helix transcriptional regulator n=1 Tax=Paludibacillus litoralis TaxID=3133267 RepID=UPI0030ED14E4